MTTIRTVTFGLIAAIGLASSAFAQSKPVVRIANLDIGPFMPVAYVAKLADKHGIQHTVLTIAREPMGPKGYKIAKAADVTVILYARYRVTGNHAFKKGELTAKAIDAIVADVSKILPAK